MLSHVGSYIQETLENVENYNNFTKLQKEIITKIDQEKQNILKCLTLNPILIGLKTIIVNVAKILLTNSDNFDVVLQCKGGQLKCHKIFLRYMSSFGYFQDFTDKDDMIVLDIDSDIFIVKCVTEYLYTRTFDENNSSFELLIQTNFFGLLKYASYDNDNTLLGLIEAHIVRNCESIMDSTIKKYNFEQFCVIIGIVCEIFEEGKLFEIKYKIVKWFCDNIELYNIHMLKKSVLFEKLMATGNKQLLIKTLDFDNFHTIISADNCHQLFDLVFRNEPDNMYNIIFDMYYKSLNFISQKYDFADTITSKCTSNIFDLEVYHKFDDNFKFLLIKKFKKYDLINDLVDMDYRVNYYALLVPEVINSNNNIIAHNIIDKYAQYAATYIRHIKQPSVIRDGHGLNLIILNYIPLKYCYCVYVGSIMEIKVPFNPMCICINLDSDMEHHPIKKGMRLIIKNDIVTIRKMVTNDELETEHDFIVNIFKLKQSYKIFFDETVIIDNTKDTMVLLIIH